MGWGEGILKPILGSQHPLPRKRGSGGVRLFTKELRENHGVGVREAYLLKNQMTQALLPAPFSLTDMSLKPSDLDRGR